MCLQPSSQSPPPAADGVGEMEVEHPVEAAPAELVKELEEEEPEEPRGAEEPRARNGHK